MYYFPQALTTLDLNSNQIGDQGAEHLATALQQNKVTRLTPVFFLFNSSCTIFHRH
jgi:hypothetical protein